MNGPESRPNSNEAFLAMNDCVALHSKVKTLHFPVLVGIKKSVVLGWFSSLDLLATVSTRT